MCYLLVALVLWLTYKCCSLALQRSVLRRALLHGAEEHLALQAHCRALEDQRPFTADEQRRMLGLV
jgi:hypothetical protein